MEGKSRFEFGTAQLESPTAYTPKGNNTRLVYRCVPCPQSGKPVKFGPAQYITLFDGLGVRNRNKMAGMAQH